MSYSTFSVTIQKNQPRVGEGFFVLESANNSQNLQFVQHRGNQNTQRQRELQLSELRAHAARQAHHNRRKIQAQKLAEQQELSAKAKVSKLRQIQERTPPRSPSPLSFATSLSKYDPFNASPLGIVPNQLLDLLDVSWNSLNAAFRPIQKGITYHDVPIWRKELATFPAISYSALAGAATMSLTGRKHLSPALIQTLEEARLQYTGLAVAQVRETLRQPGKPVSDALLFAIFCLGSHENIESTEEEDDDKPIISPLMMGSALALFARLKMSPIHFGALLYLVELKGGLEKVELPIWRELMSFIALVRATKEGIRPQLPFVESLVVTSQTQTTGSRPSRPLTPELFEPETYLPRGYADSLPNGSDAKLLDVLKHAAQVTQYVEQLCSNSCTTNFYTIVNLRNKTQHLLTDLEPKLITRESDSTDCLYEVCRLSMLTFSDMVIFPTPAITKVRQRLTCQLLAALKPPQIQKAWKDYSALLIWATTIGATASMNTPDDRELFTKILERRAPDMDLPEFMMSLRRFLWSELLTRRAQTIWAESRAYRTPESINEA